jgi:4-amino-4-deoxy-L-arabinose transferase-like glycosyltransferase
VDRSYLFVAGLTLCALVLRVRGMDEGLYRDEFYTLVWTEGQSPTGVVRALANGLPGLPLENAPPLYFLLAWLSAKLGDATTWIRLPSVILGSATVPLVFLLGLRTVGRSAAIVAAGIVALSPFAIFYGVEARPYGTLMFLSVASALVLLTAVERDRPAWWAAYGLSLAAVLYTHYAGVFVVAAQGVWALWFHRERWRPVVAVYLGVMVAYAIWLPYLHSSPADFEALARQMGVTHWDALLTWITGIQEVSLDAMPGKLALVLLGAGVIVGLGARFRGGDRSPGALVLMLAVAAPLGSLVYGLVSVDLFLFPRNLIASLPFAALALGWALTPPDRALAAAAVALAGAAFAIGAAKTLEARFHRPDFPAVASLIDRRAGEHDRVVYSGSAFTPFVLADALAPYYESRHPKVIASLLPSSSRRPDTRQASLSESFARHDGVPQQVFLIQLADAAPGPPAPRVPGWEMRASDAFPGIASLTVDEYRATAAH